MPDTSFQLSDQKMKRKRVKRQGKAGREGQRNRWDRERDEAGRDNAGREREGDWKRD